MHPKELESLIAANVRRARRNATISQAELARRINEARGPDAGKISQEHISAIETQTTTPTVGILAEIAQALGMPPDLLLRDTSPDVLTLHI